MNIKRGTSVSYLSFSIFENLPVKAAVSCRMDGFSEGVFAKGNMGLHVGDNPAAVCKNRDLFLNVFGYKLDDLIAAQQVHGTEIADVTRSMRGRGARKYDDAIPGTDGLVTNEKGIVLGLLYADCAPLLFFDPVKKVIAVGHGGWRGCAGNIAGKLIRRMGGRYGTNPKDIRAAIGPTIGQASFEVGGDVYDAFSKLFPSQVCHTLFEDLDGEKYHFDLAGANAYEMEEAGVPSCQIENCGIDTYRAAEYFYSYRKEKGHTGRHMAIISLL